MEGLQSNLHPKKLRPIAVLGAGSWGTALTLYLSRRGQTVKIWSVDRTEIITMQKDRANHRYLPNIELPDTVLPVLELNEAVKDVEDILIVVPSVGFRETLNLLKPHIHANNRIICATKGIDAATGQLLNEVCEETLGKRYPYAVLSGPSFAREVAKGLPAAVVIATEDLSFFSELFIRFNSTLLNIYPSMDVKGVEIGGVVKNVIAIAVGIVDGLGLGANTQSALLCLGLREMTQLGVAIGGQAETFLGLSGMGDLILTCSDNQSRNRRLGLKLGQGLRIDEAEKEIGQVVEGKSNAELVVKLAKKHQVSMPICDAVWQIIQGQENIKDQLIKLLAYKN